MEKACDHEQVRGRKSGCTSTETLKDNDPVELCYFNPDRLTSAEGHHLVKLSLNLHKPYFTIHCIPQDLVSDLLDSDGAIKY